MVQEFIDVISKDLLRTPPDKQMEFTIDLVLRAALVSKAP